MGFGKGSSSTQVELTPEQRDVLGIQRDALRDVFLPAYTATVGGAGGVLGQVYDPTAEVAQTALDVGQNVGALQQGVGGQSYLTGAGGLSDVAGYQRGLGESLTGAGAGGALDVAGYQRGLGEGLTGYGASNLASLFSPQYKEEQVYASLQPAREAIREQMGEQNAQFGAAGGLGSARQALARENLSQLGQQRLYSAAAQTSANVEAQRQRAAESLLGAGQGATGQAGSIYGNILGAGQGATGQAGGLFGNLMSGGQQGLTGAQQSAGARIGYAQTPQDVYSKYASVVFGVPQASTTPNFAGTQGQTATSKGFGL